MTNLKDDVSVIIDVKEGKICQGVLLVKVILFTQSSKNGDPMRTLK